jgi:hypothetical protein
MTIGPEPTPIRTGATLHTVCVTHGPLSTNKLFARVYGGKYDEDIDRHNKNTVTKLMLDPFKHNGHCVVMDSAYIKLRSKLVTVLDRERCRAVNFQLGSKLGTVLDANVRAVTNSNVNLFGTEIGSVLGLEL